MKTTVIYHSADYDGLFCREIARKFLPDAELIGWDFPDKPLKLPKGTVYVMDLPLDRVFGFIWDGLDDEESRAVAMAAGFQRVIWIDHHKSSIESLPKEIAGYRIEGVAACRLAWQWFRIHPEQMASDDASQWPRFPTDVQFKNREVSEPLAVRLAGEYDVWDHRDDNADVAFQFGLDSQEAINWAHLFRDDQAVGGIVYDGRAAMRCYAKRDADVMRARSFITGFEGFRFLCLNTARCNSQTFDARDKEATGHDALLAFYWDGASYNVSLYHAAHRRDLDLSIIATKWGGGGHRGACGFRARKLPFLPCELF